MKSLVKLLKITLAGSDKETLNEEINNKLFDHIMGGVEAVSGKFGHYYIGVSQQPKSVLPIKGTVSLYFLHLFVGSTWAQHEQATTVWRTFCCREDIRSLKIAYPRSQRLRCHFVRVVNDYTESRISTQKRKTLRNRFSWIIWGPGRVFCRKNVSKISWHCPFKDCENLSLIFVKGLPHLT